MISPRLSLWNLIVTSQMDRYDIQSFWELGSKHDAKKKKALKSLNKKIEELNKQVKLLNKELAQMNRGVQKPVKVALSALYALRYYLQVQASHNDNFSEASDHLPKEKTSASASEQPRKRKRNGSAGEDGKEYDDHQPILMIEDDLATDKKSRYLKCFEVRE